MASRKQEIRKEIKNLISSNIDKKEPNPPQKGSIYVVIFLSFIISFVFSFNLLEIQDFPPIHLNNL